MNLSEQWMWWVVGVILTVVVEEIIRRFLFPRKKSAAPVAEATSSSSGNITHVAINLDTAPVNAPLSPPASSSAEERIPYFKEHAHILFIDDQDFKQIRFLKEAGWKNIRKVDDIKNVDGEDALWAHIIFCDVRGVGKIFGGKEGGILLTRALRQRYKDTKWLILYSANRQYGMNVFDEAGADAYLPKNATLMEIEQKIVRGASKLLS